MEVVQTYTMAEAVAQGARLLDELRPGWEHTIRGSVLRGEFHIQDWSSCVAGTLELFKQDNAFRVSLNGISFHVDDPQAIWVGFTLPDYVEEVDWDALDAQWMYEVEQRIPVEAA
jgi:hypothetical protein